MINKSSYGFDIWLTRGTSFSNVQSIFGADLNGKEVFWKREYDNLDTQAKITWGTAENYINSKASTLLLGKVGIEKAFASYATVMGDGFVSNSSVIYNIYCPKGAKMLYCEPFSAYGHGTMSPNWDGKARQSSFSYEIEMLLQRSTKFRVIKVEYKITERKWYIDLEVLGQM